MPEINDPTTFASITDYINNLRTLYSTPESLEQEFSSALALGVFQGNEATEYSNAISQYERFESFYVDTVTNVPSISDAIIGAGFTATQEGLNFQSKAASTMSDALKAQAASGGSSKSMQTVYEELFQSVGYGSKADGLITASKIIGNVANGLNMTILTGEITAAIAQSGTWTAGADVAAKNMVSIGGGFIIAAGAITLTTFALPGVVPASLLTGAGILINAIASHTLEENWDDITDYIANAVIDGVQTTQEIIDDATIILNDAAEEAWTSITANLNDIIDAGEGFMNDIIDDINPDITNIDINQDIADQRPLVNFNTVRLSPLVIDMDGDGIELTSVTTSQTMFDIDIDGFVEQTAWITGGDALLAIDNNGNGIIDDRSELFGGAVIDGFTILSNLDSNSDGVINNLDTQWGDLTLWTDANEDGITDTGELITLDAAGLQSIDLAGVLNTNYTIAGNPISHESTVTWTDGSSDTIVDAWFNFDNMNSRYAEDFTLDVRTLFLPTMRGYGDAADLHIAMSLDETLLNMVQDLVATPITNFFDYQTQVSEIMIRWAGADGVAQGTYASSMDSRVIAALESFNGQAAGGENQFGSFWEEPIFLAWNQLHQEFSTRFLMQGELADAAPSLTYDISSDTYSGTLNIADYIAALETAVPAGEQDSVLYWRQMVAATDNIADNLSIAPASYETLLQTAITDSGIPFTLAQYRDINDLNTYGSTFSGDPFRFGIDVVDSVDTTTGDHYYIGRNVNGITDGADSIIVGVHGNSNLVSSYLKGARLHGGDGNDEIYGWFGDDGIIGGSGNDLAYGGIGNDTIYGGLGVDTLYGEEGDDTLQGDVGSDLIYGGAGDDTLYSHITSITSQNFENSITDVGTLHGGDGDDFLYGGFGDDLLYGDAGNDEIHSQGGDDTLDGGEGNDILYGGSFQYGDGTKTLVGGDGDDIIHAGTEINIMDGGAGNDTFVFTEDAYDTTITDASGSDTINLNWTNIQPSTFALNQVGDDLVINHTYKTVLVEDQFLIPNEYAVENINLTIGGVATTIDLTTWTQEVGNTYNGDSSANTFTGTSYDDVFYGESGNDRLFGYMGDDILYGANGADDLYGAEGDDLLIGGSGFDLLEGGDGSDTYQINLYDGVDTLTDANFRAVGGFDVVNFGTGISLDTLTLNNYQSDLIIRYNGNSNVVTVKNYFLTSGNYEYRIEEFNFDDGSSLDESTPINKFSGNTNDNTLTGTDEIDIINGDSGDDTIYAGAGMDFIYGGNDDDIIYAGSGNDYVSDSNGLNTVYLEAGDDRFVGGSSSRNTVDGGSGSDNIIGGKSTDTINHTTLENIGAQDFYDGGNNVDTINFYLTTAELTTALRTDILDYITHIQSSPTVQYDFTEIGLSILRVEIANLYIDGVVTDGGPDAVADSFTLEVDGILNGNVLSDNGSGADTAFDITLNAVAATITTLEGGSVILNADGTFSYMPPAGYIGADSFSYSIEDSYGQTDTALVSLDVTPPLFNQIDGTTGGDNITGTSGADRIYGLEGNDYLYGQGSGDELFGGTGVDRLYGGDGNDLLNGDEGNDYLYGGDGNDTINGGDGGDVIYGYATGNDTIDGGSDSSTDHLFYGHTDLTNGVNVNLDTGVVDKGNGFTDTVSNFERIELTSYDDIVTGQDTETRILTYGGDDTVYGGTARDRIYGGDGNDTLNGGDGSDLIYGQNGDDTINGDAGNDIIYGYATGNDTIDGGVGDTDHLYYNYTGITNGLNINLNTGVVDKGNGAVDTVSNFERVQATNFDDTITGQSTETRIFALLGNDTVYGGTARDRIYGGDGDDTLNGGDGSDLLYGGNGDDILNGDAGGDIIYGYATGNDIIDGGVGAGEVDHLYYTGLTGGIDINLATGVADKGNSFTDTVTNFERVHTASYDDTVTGNDANTQIFTFGGDDVIHGGTGAERLYGGDGNDIVNGGDGNDLLYGQNGDDTINAGAGSDLIYGAAGADTFIFDSDSTNGTNRVMDFDAAENDIVDLSSLLTGYDPLNDLISDFVSTTETSGDTVIAIDQDGAGSAYTFENVVTLDNITNLVLDDLINDGNVVV